MPLSCCCCFDLKFGYLTYLILYFTGKLVSLLYTHRELQGYSFYVDDFEYLSPAVTNIEIKYEYFAIEAWTITSIICIGMAINGIVKESSVLLFPFAVTSIVEVAAFVVIAIVCVIKSSLYMLFIFILAAIIQVYAWICLMGLRQKFKERENEIAQVKTTPTEIV